MTSSKPCDTYTPHSHTLNLDALHFPEVDLTPLDTSVEAEEVKAAILDTHTTKQPIHISSYTANLTIGVDMDGLMGVEWGTTERVKINQNTSKG